MKRVLAASMLLCGLILLGGAIRPDREPGIADSGGGIGMRGGASGWDTVTVIFHTQALVDAAVDTFAYPASSTAADQARIHNLNDIVLGRAEASWRDDGADAAQTVRLGTGFACPTFAWTNIKENDTDGYYPAQYQYIRSDVRQVINGTAYLQQQIGADGGNRTIPMFYIPFENHIPAGSTIVSATANFDNFNAMYYAHPDTIIATLLTNAQDNDWYTVKGGTGVTNSPNFAKASWLYQNDTNAVSGTAWGGSQANAWTPTLADRNYYWNMGSYSDWSGSVVAPGGFIAAGVGINVDITNCVQASVTGVTNNGIMALWQIAGTVTSEPLLYGWDNYSTAIGRNPYVVVKYITKRYQKPFGTADWALVFQSDDWRATANKAWADTMYARGGKFTLFGFRQYSSLPGIGTEGVNDATRCLSLSELFAVYDKGNELGSHSKFHTPAKGYHDRIVASGTGIASAAYDSMVVDYGPNWMYAVADSAGRDLRDSPRYAKSFGAPVSFLEAYAQRVLVDHGYSAWRTLATYATYDREKYYSMPAPGYRASADSAVTGGTSQAERHVRNIREQYPWEGSHSTIVGIPDSNSTSLTHLPKVAHNIRRLIEQRRGNDTRVVHFFAHDLKSGGSGNYPTEGVNADEIGRICYVTNLLGGRYMTVAELGNWFAASSTFIDHPFNAARPDTFRMYEADGVWAKPDGVDNRWIRGVR